ncbi:MAG: hypothetical protein HYZ20_09380 [Burkholderiales bacterium]|nr:hypothetical protein [Burkholderiales bacterium]
MRWKLIRRRLSISAPRMIVRSHLPWPLRWAALALALGFSAALALWAFEAGKSIAGLDAGLEREVLQLREQVQALHAERDRAQAVAHASEALLAAERTAQERLTAQLRQAESRALGLQEDLGFFERLLPAGDQPLQIRALQADAPAPGQLRYQMLVMQPARAAPAFNGRYEIVLGGQLDGQPWRMTLPDGARPLALQRYVRVEGLIDHPVAAVLQTVQARVLDEAGRVLVSHALDLAPAPSSRESLR